jgi:hypothetical protein
MDRLHDVTFLEALWILGLHGVEREVVGVDDRERAFADRLALARGARTAEGADVVEEVHRLCAAITALGRTRVKLWGTRLLVERDGERRVHELGAIRALGVERAFSMVAAAVRPIEDVVAMVPCDGDPCRAYVVMTRGERVVLRRRLAGAFERLFRKVPRLAPPRLVRTEPAPRSPRRRVVAARSRPTAVTVVPIAAARAFTTRRAARPRAAPTR